ncbi:hypothetical protein, partial [Ruminococcus callidus]
RHTAVWQGISMQYDGKSDYASYAQALFSVSLTTIHHKQKARRIPYAGMRRAVVLSSFFAGHIMRPVKK